MRTVLKISAIAVLLSILSACVVAPVPYYGHGTYYEYRHDHYRHWDRRR